MGDAAETIEDHGLAAALAAHPDALITGITADGQFCPVPPELGASQETLEGTNIFELVPQSEWARIGAGWMRVLQHGSYVGACITNEGEAVSFLTYDARERYGVIIMLMVKGSTLGNASNDLARPVVSRFGVYHRDVLANVIAVDEGAEGLLGWSQEELADKAANDLIHPDDQANGLENWLTTLAVPNGASERWRGRHLHRDGTYRWIEFTNTNRMEELGYVVSEMMDISEEMWATAALQEQKELLARLNDALPLGVCQIDRDRNVVYANNQLIEMLGHESTTELDASMSEVAEADRPALDAALTAVLDAGTDQQLEVRLSPTTGCERICLVVMRALHDTAGAVTGSVICVSDITESTFLRQELENRATYDQLTGCHNRAATMSELRRALILARTGERRPGTSVVFIDLDRFKPVNDDYGHAVGDELLVTLAARLRDLVRQHDIVGRIGGDEFLVVCPEMPSAEAAMPIARRISAALAEPVVLPDGTMLSIGASVGVAWTDAPDATPDSLVAAADAAMYRSKRQGRSEAVLAGSD